MKPFEYITRKYKITPFFGQEVKFKCDKSEMLGVIVEDLGNYVGVNFYQDPKESVYGCHPCELEYFQRNGNLRKSLNIMVQKCTK